MAREADEPRKRRQYTIEERDGILEAAAEVGVVEAARRHGVPQTTVSNWLNRDATKVAAKKAESEGATKMAANKVRSTATVAARRQAKAATVAAKKSTATVAARRQAVKAATVVTKALKSTRKKGPTLVPESAPATEPMEMAPAAPTSSRKRVARSYTPSEKAVALEDAATLGVCAASKKGGMSRFSIYEWQRKLDKANAGKGPSPTSGPAPKEIEEQRDREIAIASTIASRG